MLFNSYEFIFAFLPVVLFGFLWMARVGGARLITVWLVLVSLFFYAWWNLDYLLLLVPSILVNFALGSHISRNRLSAPGRCRTLMILGIGVNLGLIAYFKYAGFLIGNWNALAGTSFDLGTIVLPLAISFFTFQQIAFLVDAYRGETREYSLTNYALFVTFFPQLIAGPIVHHREVMPQFARLETTRPKMANLAIGTTIFAIGLFKKAVLADGIAVYANPVFAAAGSGATLSFMEAWGGALAYSFQLYFDFSGYSDMAIGSARLFGIKLPLNFNSPYKARSIIDFWRSWHMTLSRFLQDYVYIPLGGNRKGPRRRYINLFITMLLGGLWHGAAWTFVAWGALHGFYLVVNHAWRQLCRRSKILTAASDSPVGTFLSIALTFMAVVVGWVFFRAPSFDAAQTMLRAMAGLNGIQLPAAILFYFPSLGELSEGFGITFRAGGGEVFLSTWTWILALGLITWGLPNTQQVMRHYQPSATPSQIFRPLRDSIMHRLLVWRPSVAWSAAVAVLFVSGIFALPQVSEFLYFQF